MKIICVVGTRPEAIKMAPVIKALQAEHWCDVKILATAQHRGMLDQVLDFFQIVPDYDLDVMTPNQTLSSLTAKILLEVDKILAVETPDVVLVQGDTTTVMTVALSCFYRKIAIGHVEAGLRTWDMQNPFPEEANRVITARLAKWHFAPTKGSMENLKREGVAESSIVVTGNTVIDALMLTIEKDVGFELIKDPTKKMVLITSHRRENFGDPFVSICSAIKILAEKNRDIDFVYPVHPNPNIKDVAHTLLGSQENIYLCEPFDYAPFISAMKRSYIIISDSGGVQEEAPALGKPVLVLRDETERPEAVDLGVVKLVGSNCQRIVDEAQRLIDDPIYYASIAKGVSPYGDGKGAERIVNVLREYNLR